MSPTGSSPRSSRSQTSQTRLTPTRSRCDQPARWRIPAKTLTVTRIPWTLVRMNAASGGTPEPRRPGWQAKPQPKRRGWRPPRRPLGPVGSWVVALIVVAFFVNYWVASRTLSEPPRVRIPYSPLFLDQVRDGNVERITSKGTALQGVFFEPVRYPPSGSDSRSARRFSTLIPSFADTKALSNLLEEKKVVINAEPLQSGAAWWQT